MSANRINIKRAGGQRAEFADRPELGRDGIN